MKNTIVYCLFIVALLLRDVNMVSASPAKSSSSKYIKGFGWGIASDGRQTAPYASYSQMFFVTHDTFRFVEKRRAFGFSFIHVDLDNHFLIRQFNDDKSLSLNFHPSIGLGFTRSRILNVTLPFFLNYNIGAVATYQSRKSTGLTVGIGAEYIKAGLISIKDNYSLYDFEEYENKGFHSILTNIIQPAVNLGLRYLTRGSHAQELNFKFGLRPTKIYDEYNGLPTGAKTHFTAFWFRLSMVHYINY